MAERPIIRVAVEAKDAEEFVRTASVRLRGEFFAPWDGPVAATVRFEMPFAGTVGVRGEATARAAVVGGRKGVMLRAVRLDPDGVQVPLADEAVPTPLDESWEDFDEPSETQRSKVPQKVAARMVVSGRPRVPTRNITKRMPTLVPTRSADASEFASSPVTRPNERLSASLAEELRKKETRSVPPPREKTPPPRPPPGGRERPPPPMPRARTEPPRPPPASTSEAPHTHAAPRPAPEPEMAPEVDPTPAVEPTPEPESPRPPRTEPVPEIPAEVRGRRLPLPTDPPAASRPRRASRRIWIAAAVVLAGAGAATFAFTRGRGGDEDAHQAPAPRGDETTTTSPELERHLALADQRLAEGRLTGPGGDAALDHLVAARQLATDDPRVVSRLGALADTFEKLATGALDAGDLGEAAAHLQAALIADPGRQRAGDKLHEIEARVRSDQRNR